jgi:hypothetical protein
VDFYRLVRSRLSGRGIFGQWIQTYEISLDAFRVILASLREVFPFIAVFQSGPTDVIVLASAEPIRMVWPDFEARFAALLSAKRETAEDVQAAVRTIIADVRETGDEALLRYTEKVDRLTLSPKGLAVSAGEFAAAERDVDQTARDALVLARDRIEAFHRRQLPQDDRYTDALGVELGIRWTAIESVGLYVPGGSAAYPSSVLMNAVPAKVAGVERVVMVSPAPDGRINSLVLVAARLAGVDGLPSAAQAVRARCARRSRSPRSSALAMPTSSKPSGRSSARSRSTCCRDRAKSLCSPMPARIRHGSPPTSLPRPSTTRWRRRSWSPIPPLSPIGWRPPSSAS